MKKQFFHAFLFLTLYNTLQMLISPISYNDTNRFKGMAILLIVLHNFYHVLPQAPIENEFSFNIENTNYYFKTVIDSFSTISITSLFTDFFSFFGHYGVALFIFLSGYGLTIKYSSKEFPNAEKIHFIWKRILRFWKVIIPLIPLSVFVKIVEQNLGVPIGILYLLTSILIAYIFQQLLNRIYTYCQTIIVQKKQ
ncbi:acyltransferase family protein [Coprobacter fastidiosus]|jgi:peptidoglycan/LPS O-acetylase OafA/YrhL|uniref:acyltransferase family protein n=1 Tax=Coprobacter fastidiosus TaxID=1099853 RepID=UPI00266ED6D2|nr:acyltransferase family protein [Coprobacter fastidiosus]